MVTVCTLRFKIKSFIYHHVKQLILFKLFNKTNRPKSQYFSLKANIFVFNYQEIANNWPGRFPIPLVNVRAGTPQQAVRPIGPAANANPIPGLPGPAVQNDRNLNPAVSVGAETSLLIRQAVESAVKAKDDQIATLIQQKESFAIALARVEAENVELKKEAVELKKEAVELKKEVVDLKKENGIFREEMLDLKKQIADLKKK